MPRFLNGMQGTTNQGKWRHDSVTKIVRDVLAPESHCLSDLVDCARRGEESFFYLARTRIDRAFGFGSNEGAIGLSVLPQEGAEAGVPGLHPGSSEVYVVFQGKASY